MDILRGGWAPGLLGNGAGLRADSPSTGGYSTEAEAIFAAFTTPPTTGRKDLIDAAVVALKTAGVWTKLDALYALAAADSQAAKINWVAPGTYNCTEVNAPAFAADQGFTGASTKYLDTGFNLTTAPSPKFVRDSACVFAYANTNVGLAISMFGVPIGSVAIFPNYGNGNFYMRINNASANVTAASATSIGLWAINRSASTLATGYKNGVSVGTDATASTAVTNEVITALKDATAAWTGQMSCCGFGSSLNSTEQTALYNALRTYLTGVGVP